MLLIRNALKTRGNALRSNKGTAFERGEVVKNEYSKHLRATLPAIMPYSCVLIAALVLWNVAFSYFIMPIQREQKSIAGAKYAYAVESSERALDFWQYQKLDNLVTVFNSSESHININLYVQTEPKDFEIQLASDEIAVSEKISQELNVGVGDIVTADIPIYDHPISYRIAVILPYGSDLYDVGNNLDFSYAVVGDDGVLANKANSKTVYFLSATEYAEFRALDYSYAEIYQLQTDSDVLGDKQAVMGTVFLIGLVALVGALVVLIHRSISTEVRKYYYDSFPVSLVSSFLYRDHFIFLGIPIALHAIWLAMCFWRIGFGVCIYVCGAVLPGLELICAMIIGGRRYEKAN